MIKYKKIFIVINFILLIFIITSCKDSNSSGESTNLNHTHNYSTEYVLKEATCTSEGILRKVCSCGLYKDLTISKLDHDYKENYLDTNFHNFICKNCNTLKSDEKEEHSFTTSIKEEATCTDSGILYSLCKCGYSKEDEISALGHSYSIKVETIAATKDERGYTIYKCERCESTIESDFTYYNEHIIDYTTWLIDIKNGTHYHGCNALNERHDEESHTFGDWVINKMPTDTTLGSKYRLCVICNYAETVEFN